MTEFEKHKTTIFGRKNEKKFGKYIKRRFNGVEKNLCDDGTDKEPIDYVSDSGKRLFEFKSRMIRHDKYDTALVNNCKLKKFLEYDDYRFHIYYLYKNGLYRVEITKDYIKTLPKPRKLYSYQECRRGGYAWVVDIPSKDLKFIRSLESYNNIVNEIEF